MIDSIGRADSSLGTFDIELEDHAPDCGRSESALSFRKAETLCLCCRSAIVSVPYDCYIAA